MPGYNPSEIEKKWQAFWAAEKTFATPPAKTTGDKPKFYALDMFPYPSGQGLHVGHPEGYTATDIVSRYKRGKGFNVLHPMGWDAFGLPAEQYAIKNNVHPKETTANNINRFRTQLQSIGFSYDWDREVDTTDEKYYKWTQWIFLQLFDTWFDEAQQKGRPISELIAEFKSGKRAIPGGKSWDALSATEQRKILADYRLAYEAEVPVNWCAGLGTVLANEEVIDGKSEVGGFPVERRPMKQWMLRITAYSERLIGGLENLEWSDSLKEMQRNWIGRSEGAQVKFQIADSKESLAVFTTRPDTLFGATYMVMAPEHPLVETITSAAQREKIAAYKKWAAGRSDRERQEDTTKTGEATGAFAINPVNGARIPIYISDYVLMGYGTGAIMAVPAHDERDHEFATKFKLPIIQVVGPKDGSAIDVQSAAFVEDGVAVNSDWINGLGTQAAKSKTIALLEEKKIGTKTVNYKIRDWLFSRQRYWGEPFPLVHLEDGTTVPLAADQLPLTLPELEDFKPTGTIDPPLSKAKAWVNVHVVVDANGAAKVVPPGTPGAVAARRELNTMPQWAGSCWYYIRYCDARNDKAFVDPAIEKYWMGNGVDLYIGGVEHAVLHLLYSRFWHNVLFDRGFVSCSEPFRKLVNQGLILGEDGQKMSKSRGNVVNPDDVIKEYGADSLRLFEMFMGPLEQVKPWSTAGVEGVYRFLQRVWRNLFDENDSPKVVDTPQDDATNRALHKLIKRVGDDIERLSFNTAIAGMMEFNNLLAKAPHVSRQAAVTFARVIEPFAPHFAEEVHQRLTQSSSSVSNLPWPGVDAALLVDATVEIPVQVNGKLAGRVTVDSGAGEEAVVEAALANAEVQLKISGKPLKKKIYVKGRMLNLVI
jgi:leucyl-tRNA synthetase